MDSLLNCLIDEPSGKLSSQLLDKLRGMILEGKLPAGYAFPNENEFCAFLKVGRGTLREAYLTLENEGFITRTKRGTKVNDIDEIFSKIPLGLAAEVSEFNDLLEFRAMLEEDIAALAALRASEDNLRVMEHSLEQMKLHVDNVEVLSRYDTAFHLEMAKASGNKLLSNIMSTVVEPFTASVYYIFARNKDIRKRAIEFHGRILNAVKERDADEARSMMRDHVCDVLTYEKDLEGTKATM